MAQALGYQSVPAEYSGDGPEQVVCAARYLQAGLLVVHPSSANDRGGPDVGAPGADPVRSGRRWPRAIPW
jgi:hypothetical protein